MSAMRFPPDDRHNVVLVGGPGHGMYLGLDEGSTRLVWYDEGEYRKTEAIVEGRSIFVWHPAEEQ